MSLKSNVLMLFLMFSTVSSAFELDPALRSPCQTGIPSPLRKPKDITPLGCDRPFLYRSEVYSTDPPQAQDASTLKYFVQTVPEAKSILDGYQSARNKSKMGAYIGTLGALMFILSNPIANQFNASTRDTVRNSVRLGGIVLATGGFFFTFAYLHDNESKIPKAVEAYNKAKPNDPIELQFNTGWSF